MNFLLAIVMLTPELKAGGVEVIREEERIYYILKGGVTVRFDDKTLIGKEGIYFEDRGIAKLYGGVELIAPSYIVRSESLKYFEKEKSVVFMGSVSVKNERKIFCDSLLARKDTVYLRGKVRVESHKVTLKGRSGIYFADKEKGFIEGEPKAIIGDTSKVVVTGEKIEFGKDTMKIIGHVLFISDSTRGSGDTLIYLVEEDRGVLKHNVKLNFKGGFAISDSASFSSENGKLKEVIFMGKARIVRSGEEGEITLLAPYMKAVMNEGEFVYLSGENLEEGIYREREENGKAEGSRAH